MSSSLNVLKNDDNLELEISLTPPPLPDKHVSIDMFSANDQTQPDDDKNHKMGCTTPTIVYDDPEQESLTYVPKKLEPVLGKERAIKILKAFGCQQKPIKELHHNVLKTTPIKDSNKPRKEKKSLTPMQKAKETISEIEELKKIKDRMIPTYFGENVVIHHIKVAHSLNDTRLDNNSSCKSDNVDKVSNEPVGRKSIVDSLEALKVYNNLDADKQSDDEMISDKEENHLNETGDDEDLTELIRKKKRLPAAFDLKAKRAKEKRRKRRSLDSRSSDKKQKRRSKDKKKRKSRDSLSQRSSTNKSEKRSKKKRDLTHSNEIPTCKVFQPESHISEYSFERFTKTLPTIKYSANPRYNRQSLTNGLSTKVSKTKKKKRSTSKTKSDKEKCKKSLERGNEKSREKEKRRRRSGSKSDAIKAIKRQRRGLDKNELNLSSNAIDDKMDVEAKTNPEQKSPNSEEYVSNWDHWDDIDDITVSSMENIMSLETIPLQLNVPKQDRSILYTNDCSTKVNDEFNQITPRMTGTDSTVATPILSSNSPEIKDVSELTDSDDRDDKLSERIVRNASMKHSIDDDLEIVTSKPAVKNTKIVDVKSSHQPIAQLYDEYEQFIMSCMPVSDESKQSNGEKASIELLDEMITSNDGEEELEALKKSLEKKLLDIEHNDLEDAIKMSESDQSPQRFDPLVLKPISTAENESSDSSSSSTSSSSSESSSSSSSSSSTSSARKKQLKKKTRKEKEDILSVMLNIDDNIFNLKSGIEDDELSDNELMSKVEQLKQQMNEKRKALANKRKLNANDTDSPATSIKSDVSSDALLSPEKRSAISLKIGNSKSNSMKVKPVTLDDDDFTEKLMLEVSGNANTVARAKETNKLLIERVIEPAVGMVSSSNSNSLASEITNTKVTRIGILPTPCASDIFGKNHPGATLPLESAVTKIAINQSFPMDTSEMKNYLNNATYHLYDSSDSITSKTSASVDSSMSNNSFPAVIHKISPVKHQSPPNRFDKRDSSDLNSRIRPNSPHQRSRTKDSSKRHYSPPPFRHRSPRSRRRSFHRSPSPIRKRSRGSPRRSRSPRRSPRRHSPRQLRKSLSPRSKRSLSPIRGRKWEPPHADYIKSSTKSVLDCENVPQPICRLENNPTTWSGDQNSAFAQYDYHHPLSPKRSSLDERIAHSFDHSDQSYNFQQASSAYMNHFEYSAENSSKIPVLNSQESYYFQPQHLRPQNLPPQPNQLPQHMPHQHVVPHVQHMIPNPLPPPQPLPTQQRFSNLIEIRQSNITEVEPTPFVLKGNVLEIVPNAASIVVKPTEPAVSKLDDRICEMKIDIKVELTEEEMELRESKKAEIKLKRKQERDKRHLERFMRKEKLRLEIKHLMELGAPIPDVKKASYNPNATGGKSILRLVASSSNKKSVLFADGVAPGDGTSTSGGEDVAPMLRDRNKRMTKRKLDSKRRRARREASIIKKDVVAQIADITPFIDPELENMPPPPPPEGSPPARLPQPKLKSTPKLIYFHYDPHSNAMYVSPYPTPVHIPQKPSDKTFSAITKLPSDSPTASSTPDQIQRPKVCFIQPPTQETGPIVGSQPLPNSNQQPHLPIPPPTDMNSISSVNATTALPPIKLFNQQPSPLPNPSVLYPPRHPQSISPQNYRMPVHPAAQQPMQIQPLPNMTQWDNSNYAANSALQPQPQPQPCSQVWESDRHFPQTPPVHPSVRFSNNIPQQRPSRNQWDQQRHPTPIFQNSIHSPQTSFSNIQSHPPVHPMFHQNQAINLNSPHQQQQPQQQHQSNNFAFSNNHSLHYNSQHPNPQWNHTYRNNH